MALVDTIRSAVKIADGVTQSLQVRVKHEAWIGQDYKGSDTFAAAVYHLALVTQDRKPIYSARGIVIMTKAYIAFLRPIFDTVPKVGQTRVNPIDPRDVLTLPDGTTGLIVRGGGLVDSSTSRPFYA